MKDKYDYYDEYESRYVDEYFDNDELQIYVDIEDYVHRRRVEDYGL